MASLRQLLVISSIVIACILVGMLAMGLSMMSRSLQIQSQADSENAVATLALALQGQPDAAARARVLDAAFQQGRFQTLRLESADGGPVYEGTHSGGTVGDAPAWFAGLAAAKPHVAQRRLADGASLGLVMDPRPGLDALWAHAVQWALLALGIAAFWALFAAALIARLHREFGELAGGAPEIKVTDSAPADAAELIDVVDDRVPPTVDEQLARIEILEIELNRDPVTGLANRAYFLNALKRLLRDDTRQGAVSGYILLMRQRDMARIQNQTPRGEVDDWLRLLGQRLTATIDEYPATQSLVARLNGADFVVLFPVGGGPEVMRPIQRLRQVLDTLRLPLDSHNLSRWALALTDYTAQCTTKEVLTRLDLALMCAESAGHAEVEFMSHADRQDDVPLFGEASWRALIGQALAHDRFKLDARPVLYEGDEIGARYEATLSLHEDDPGQPAISGFLFMPAAQRLGLSAACDLRAIALGLGWLGAHEGALVVRASVASLLDGHFRDEAAQLLRRGDEDLAPRLAIELDAYGLVHHPEVFKAFAQAVMAAGSHVGLRGLDMQTEALQHIHEVDFTYVKLGGSLVRNLVSSPGGAQILIAVTETAIGMGMKVYVDDVEDARARRMVEEYGALPRAVQPA
ncbi:EAL domain-containing protein [Castellaniella sp. GW247-6E4]|uniref:EAL domain-containing protein n=1 Tax=Castellaniella sp. GW247-6E4 TaxID=3140380 RepID=UPI0033146DAF